MREVAFSLRPTLAEVARATQHARALLPDWLEPGERDAIELGLAEALTNIVEHGYGGREPAGEEVRVRMLDRAGALEVEVLDRGRPIPPGRLEQADDTTFQYDPTDIQALPEGGLGLALIKAAFHEVRYRRQGGVNRLVLVKRA